MRYFEEAERTGTLRMHDALRNSLAGEVGQLVDQVDVLEENRTTLTDRLRASLHANGSSTRESGHRMASLGV